MPPDAPALFTLADWRAAYAGGARPADLLLPLATRLAAAADDEAWIHRCGAAFVQLQCDALAARSPADLPLYGVPFAVKDNIDVAGLPTTAACPAFAHTAAASATVVQRLMAAGAVLLGKTNLDQFATGLVGTRSPYGEVPNTFDPAYVSGGSSSGSASVVARGLVAFALGTDTAGSGRVPAGFNNLVGLKPTPGRVPMAGVLPACRTLDVVSVFALTVADAAQVMAVMESTEGMGGVEGVVAAGRAPAEPRFQQAALQPAWLGRTGAKLRVGVPIDPGCDAALGYDTCFEEALAQLADPEVLGAELVPVDMAPLLAVAQLLYDGPWVAERHAVVQALMDSQPEALDPTVFKVIAQAHRYTATDAFNARYRLETLRQQIAPLWQAIDVLVVPTAPTCPTRAAVAAEPVLRNAELGKFTNFVNLLGQSALAVPSGFAPGGPASALHVSAQAGAQGGLPFGITFIAPGGSDAALVDLALRWEAAHALPLGRHLRAPRLADRPPASGPARLPAAAPTMELAVVGAHLQGMPLHGQLVERGCRLLERTHTAPHYRLYALPGTTPPKPGLARVEQGGGQDAGQGGAAIALEVYEMPLDRVGSFLALIPPPLGLGTVQLADGRWCKGFICEPAALATAQDITHLGGWRAYVASLAR